jgi:F-type H+-transporting ATPase subunit epsilon
MRDDLNLKILSPENTAFTGSIRSVHVPAALGELEIFLNHASLVSSLLPGVITVRHLDNNKDTQYFTNGGYIDVHHNEVTLILDDIIDMALVTKEYYQNKINAMNAKLSETNLDDNDYEKITQTIALYQQYAA